MGLVRLRNGNPQYTVGHFRRMKAIHESLHRSQGLWLIGGAYGGVSVPDCISQARQVAEVLAMRYGQGLESQRPLKSGYRN